MTEEEEVPSEIPKEKKRTRKKQLYSNIKGLMEFYFSAANLTKDRWLCQSLDENDSTELTNFLRFNKIRALTDNVNDIVKALRTSEILEVTEDCKVKRKVPLQFKENQDDCIVYIEQIPPDADHDWVKNFFSCYGPIDYISLPKYSSTKKCKGFAFIEFSEPQYAEKAIEDYKKAGRYLSNSIEPKDLLSISTYEKKGIQLPEMSNNRKRKIDESGEECSDAVNSDKKLKLNENEECLQNLESHIVEIPVQEDSLLSEECNEGNMDESRKKKNRKKKKKSKRNKFTPETTGFQILSKKDWKCLRNKYLNIQRAKMKQLKTHLKQKRRQPAIKRERSEEIQQNNNEKINNDHVEKTSANNYIPGLIVKIEVNEPIIELKQFKNEVKSKNDEIKYIDVKEGAFSAFVRFSSPDAANGFCEKSVWNNAEILKGEEESQYWQKLEENRQAKLSKANAKAKKRGKDKLLKKAETELGKHICFEDE